MPDGARSQGGRHRDAESVREESTGPEHVTASVIIPTWNSADLLDACLRSLMRQEGTGWTFEIIVVDNGSTDRTADVLDRYPSVRAVSLSTNRGFAAGVNAGIRDSIGEVVVLLNDDTEVDPRWLVCLLEPLWKHAEVGMVTSNVRLYDRPDHLHTTGDVLAQSGEASNRGYGEVDRGQYDDAVEVFGANAAAAGYRRTMLDEIGLFEEAFESYYEDVDLAWRGRLAGWRCVFVPDAVVLHHVSATGGGPYASYRVARNRIWTIARCYPTWSLWRHRSAVLRAQWRHLRDALRQWRGHAARATLRGLLVGILTWPRWWAERRRIQGARQISDAEFDRWLVPSPGHRSG